MLSSARAELLSLPTKLAPQCAGMVAREAEEMLRDAVYQSLYKLSETGTYEDEQVAA